MHPPQGYLAGRFMPVSEMAIPVTDAGFSLGTTVTEQLRTFGGKLFQLDQHLLRLQRSLDIVGLKPVESLSQLAEIATNLVYQNYQLLAPGDDLGLSLFVTPGGLPRFHNGAQGLPCVGMHTFPLPFQLWDNKYLQGQSLIVTEIKEVSPQSWPTELKCRSRMHYYLADKAASRLEPGSRAILLDANGCVIEASTANILLYHSKKGFFSPPGEVALPGISLRFLQTLAADLGIDWNHRFIVPEEVTQADEIFLTSTPFCLLPVTSFNGNAIHGGCPGPMFTQLAQTWSHRIGFDFIEQAIRFANRTDHQK